jgi:spermidine synthase
MNHPPVTLSEADGVRYLHLGSIWVQGAMRLKSPQFIELEYVRRMLASLLWLPTASWQQPRGRPQAVQFGLGAGAITRFTAQQLGFATTVVEINPWVVEVGRRWFRLPVADPLLTVLAMDAARWLHELATPRSALLLHVDLYDEEADRPVLDDEAFYAGCRRLLAPGGVMSVNLFGRRASYAESSARIAAAFGADQVWSLQPTREGNTTVVAGHAVSVPSREELTGRAEALEARFGTLGLKPRQWLRMVRPYAGQAASAAAGEPAA